MQKHPEKPRERKFQAAYYVEYEGQRVQVCQKCFLQCFDESASFVKTVLKKKLFYPDSDFFDKRGSGGGKNKLTDEKIQLVKDHINSFPKYESHYTRRDTSVEYLHADVSLSQMYNLFCNKFKHDAISISAYSSIFKTMNIKFKKPKLDTCSSCEKLRAKIGIAKQEGDSILLGDLENELLAHQNKADLAYESKRNDKTSASADPTVKVYTFDLQQCLPTPFLRNSISFYKRQLWTYSLTVHDCTTGIPHCFMWHEALSARGVNQIASCLFSHINNLSEVNHAIFYSDSCMGQNKNSFVCAMFILAMEINSTLETIDHKFLEPGHTHMECDVDHSVIERKKKRTEAQIHHPHDWYNFVRSARSRNAFNVIEMNLEDFFDFRLLLKTKLMWRSTNQDGEKFVWKDIRWLRFKKANFAKILYKTTLDEDAPFKTLNLLKRGVNSIVKADLPLLTDDAKISSKKKKDLLDLLPFVNPCFHPFYKSLLTDNSSDIHPDLVEDELEVE
ncbi:uncharacterized protein [Eurosta solidaginis]|uniref:uncharacterized protein n=1 Tax=Eurosta solidaginis TaxID=178769 RepID=UPI003530AE84